MHATAEATVVVDDVFKQLGDVVTYQGRSYRQVELFLIMILYRFQNNNHLQGENAHRSAGNVVLASARETAGAARTVPDTDLIVHVGVCMYLYFRISMQ